MKKVLFIALAFLSLGSYAQSNTSLNFNNSESAVVSAQNGVTIGIDLIIEKNNINIYSFGQNIFVNTTNINNGVIEIYNVSGKLIVTELVNSNLQTISIAENSSAIYIVKVTTENSIYTEKVFIK